MTLQDLYENLNTIKLKFVTLDLTDTHINVFTNKRCHIIEILHSRLISFSNANKTNAIITDRVSVIVDAINHEIDKYAKAVENRIITELEKLNVSYFTTVRSHNENTLAVVEFVLKHKNNNWFKFMIGQNIDMKLSVSYFPTESLYKITVHGVVDDMIGYCKETKDLVNCISTSLLLNYGFEVEYS